MKFSFCYKFLIRTAILVVVLGAAHVSIAQEINADITVDRSQISGTSLGFLDNLPGELEAYINEYDWIDADFREQERINMEIRITLLGVDDNYNFEAQVFIRSRRPIYNTPRQTPLFLFSDDEWNFNYKPNRSLTHDELQFDPLTSLIDFYAYIILGFDFDTFEELGGSSHYRDARNIVSLAQTTTSAGWSRGSNRRNRAQLTADLLSTSFEPFRIALYQYHRQGLDMFLNDPAEGRQQVLQALEKIQEAQRNSSSDLLFDTFFNAKYRELVLIFEDADPQIRLEAYNLLSQIDQSHLSEYRKLQ
jgi:hypothetical protein